MIVKYHCWQNDQEEYFEFVDGTDKDLIKDHFKRWVTKQCDAYSATYANGEFHCYMEDGVIESNELVGGCEIITPKKVDIS